MIEDWVPEELMDLLQVLQQLRFLAAIASTIQRV